MTVNGLALKVVVRACYGTYSVVHVFKYLAPNFCFQETRMMLLFRISVLLSGEPLTAHAVFYSQHA